MPVVTRLMALLKRPEEAALAVYLLFTLTAVVGFGTFGMNPEWLAGRPGLIAFYEQSFTLFGQGHVLVGAVVLGFLLIRNAGLKWFTAFALIYVVSFLSEFVGTGYGLPFGHYFYTDLLGPKLFERVPALIPLSWFLMALPSYVIVRRRLPARAGTVGRIALASFLFVIWDLSLDPAMSYLTSYWIWEEGGPYYGMPLINLAGWLGTAVVLMLILEFFSGEWVDRLSARWCTTFYGITLLMSFGMVLVAGLWLSVILTIAGLGICAFFLRKEGTGQKAIVAEQRSAHTNEHRGSQQPSISKIVGSENADDIFARHARSFSFASWWFSRRDRRLIACLYAFCRTTDDLVDGANGQPREQVERRLEAWRQLARNAYVGEASGIQWLDEIMTASREAGVPPGLIDELVAGVRTDIGPVDLKKFAELDRYSYRVASVVGIWTCYLAGVSDPKTLAKAATMGRAMQLTNILRDVGEDLDNGRIYLPAELRKRYGITESDLYTMRETGNISPEYRNMIEALMARAEAAYESAFPALTVLPPAYAHASAVAAEVYRGIHRQIRQNEYNNLQRRAYTGTFRKVYLGIRALRRLAYIRRHGVASSAGADLSRTQWHDGLFKRARSWMAGMIFVLFSVIAVPAQASECDQLFTREVETMELDTLREQYVEAVEDEEVLEQTIEALKDRPEDSLYEEAYAAALVVLRARHAFWPHNRLRYVRDGLGDLDEIVAHCPNEVEVRYLRLLSGYFLPGILGRTEYVKDDFAALARLLPDANDDFPPDLYEEMVRFVMENGDPTDEEYARLDQAKEAARSAQQGDV